jgi:hypothetical protein
LNFIIGYRILAYRRHPPEGRWLAEIRKTDGSALVIQPPDGGTRREFITTSAATFSADAAIALAKRSIDGGGMKWMGKHAEKPAVL